ncbi:A1 cistron-splicing factor, AAR2 [Kalmanozyma brasiliensis GHG001]|uniref:A1 cistron-splicing factor AAR2 n=1 Tax=Kalmanozyma brasiliensis (strain GHG001) TaxID=1365824 RepID=V5E7G5_KALBG|nr:A1 cistron-splicing factor, AAR2 [Kalmanozyma brasiliensis GHG001]EST06231.1 A1 cistron-splicing factor, AAR2 [Kalmanozyma brasiliensis GHG001]
MSSATATLLLKGLPGRTQLALDAQQDAYLNNEQFTGIKNLPAGWHCVSWSIATTSSDDTPGPSTGAVRNLLLRYFDEGEVVARELDRGQQRLAVSGSGRSTRRRVSRTIDPSASRVATIVTPDVRGSVEERLLPYPTTAGDSWRAATRHLSEHGGHVGRQVVAKVLGVDSEGDSITDSLAAGPAQAADGKEETVLQQSGNSGRREHGKVVWGKSRPEAERFEVLADGDETDEGDPAQTSKKRSNPDSTEDADDEALHFTPFDLRRSWPPHSTGSDITRWSQDKSWLLRDVARRSSTGIIPPSLEANNEWSALLCELELTFIIFIAAGNGYAWQQWFDLVAVFCRSSSLMGAQSAFELHPSTTPTDLTPHIAFMSTLRAQLVLLPIDFWSTQEGKEEQTLLAHLDALRVNIARSLSAAASTGTTKEEEQRQALVQTWRALSHTTATAFGWQLDHQLDEEAEVHADLEADEGEGAPVIVDL